MWLIHIFTPQHSSYIIRQTYAPTPLTEPKEDLGERMQTYDTSLQNLVNSLVNARQMWLPNSRERSFAQAAEFPREIIRACRELPGETFPIPVRYDYFARMSATSSRLVSRPRRVPACTALRTALR